jgi:uncharacterized protein YndB with AHSA1/START domain
VPDAANLSGPDHESVERVINAPAAAIFALLADPARHADIDGSGTVQGTPEGSQQLALGSTFGMSMRQGFGYSMVNTIIEFEQDRRIAWQTRPPKTLLFGVMDKMVGGRIWRYELEPVEGGTLVRETWDISQERVKAMVRPLRKKASEGMTATLARIATLVESDA